ncbi:uncharacterized protein LOC101864695 [Aplysia californica]|uniref:Uncharacterized protein LOC101864695 n=1 Tax=Aplysia californica TaxID=6500 RepID=A0ABM1A3D5_APLCA|nr:uncharacterized protein LOC101864695 [Aplysia californica]
MSNQVHNASCVFRGWYQVTRASRQEKQTVLQFQVQSYTLLVQRLFHQWLACYQRRRQVQQERVWRAERSALELAAVWRRKAQTSRGARVKVMFQHRKMALYFNNWQKSLDSVQSLYDTLEVWNRQRNARVMTRSLKVWRTQLVADQAKRDYTQRYLYTVWSEWRVCAKVNKERRIRGLALKKALQERSLHVYFQYWSALTLVKRSVQHNVETRIQIRVLREWHMYTRNTRYLRQLQAHMTKKVNTRVLHSAFSNMRWKAEYCVGLAEMADKMAGDRRRATMQAVMVVWRDRLDNIMAARCYGQLLVVRVARQWRRFVQAKKRQRQKEQEQWDAAVSCHSKTLRMKVMAALKTEVCVARMAQKRRQRLCDKYAVVWKTRVDREITAQCLEREFLYRQAWSRWRVEFSRRKAADKICGQDDRHSMSQTFKAWRRLTRPQQRTPRGLTEHRGSLSSLLPVPISQSRHSPSSASSSSSGSYSAAEQSFGYRGGKR